MVQGINVGKTINPVYLFLLMLHLITFTAANIQTDHVVLKKLSAFLRELSH